MRLTLLEESNPVFPSVTEALSQPDGLLAVGGNLYPETLSKAYERAIFPWYTDDEPILWWSPSNRCVLMPENFYISRSLRRVLRQKYYSVTSDMCFRDVVVACSKPRDSCGTWINSAMIDAYSDLHNQGQAHSIEVWDKKKLVGGIYGVLVGGVFSGESMFSVVNNGSKIAMAHLCQYMSRAGMFCLDCQIENSHLMTLGTELIPRSTFVEHLSKSLDVEFLWDFNNYSNWIW